VKNVFYNVKFSEFRASGDGVKNFWWSPQKAHPWLVDYIFVRDGMGLSTTTFV